MPTHAGTAPQHRKSPRPLLLGKGPGASPWGTPSPTPQQEASAAPSTVSSGDSPSAAWPAPSPVPCHGGSGRREGSRAGQGQEGACGPVSATCQGARCVLVPTPRPRSRRPGPAGRAEARNARGRPRTHVPPRAASPPGHPVRRKGVTRRTFRPSRDVAEGTERRGAGRIEEKNKQTNKQQKAAPPFRGASLDRGAGTEWQPRPAAAFRGQKPKALLGSAPATGGPALLRVKTGLNSRQRLSRSFFLERH